MDSKKLKKAIAVLNEERQRELWQYITEIRNGNRESFNQLYSCTENYIYYCIVKYGIPEDSIVDVMQEVYAAIYQNLETLRNTHAALGWMKSITFHKCMDYFRHSGKELLTEDDNCLEKSVIDNNIELPEDIIDNRETQKIISNLIDELPRDYRQILVAYYFNEAKLDEIAEALEIPEGTVKTKLYRARRQLRESIEKLEKKQGIRLHSVSAAPILLLLFQLEAETAAVPAGISEAMRAALQTILEQLSEASGGAVGSRAALHLSEPGRRAAETGSKLAGTAAEKCIIGIAAALLVGGGILFFNQNKDDSTNTEMTTEAVIDTEERRERSNEIEEQPQADEMQDEGGQIIGTEQTNDPERQAKILQYYHGMFDKICETHQWPDGTDLSISGEIMEALQYAVLDFDGDGYDELAVSVITADFMSAYREEIYKYNPDTEQCSRIAAVFPGAEYYDNGVVFGPLDNSHRFGKDLFQYDAESGAFVRRVYIFQWSRSLYENYSGHPFPDAADRDGDGVVWCFIDTDDNYTYMEQDEYDAWCLEQIYSARRIEISWYLFSAGWQYE